MSQTRLEHANVTVSDIRKTTEFLKSIFGWKTRWEGDSIHGGRSAHVGGDDSYLAIYQHPASEGQTNNSYKHIGGLNHLAVVVDDLDATEKRVIAAGFKPQSHADYEPGRRFYFDDHDGIEYEVVQYD
ncbi:VOC family protein [Falsihalocynthiibacter sp. SS001]|uniref:VOC family protein n=1 Tax=Falsihalocynthiibacter sp. SS001 TaxID=3349698 RepID=UPI0036D2D21E